MYQFTTTSVINSNLDSNGTTAKYAGTATTFRVTRVNTFKKAGIVSVYKRPYQAGVKEVATITMPTATSGKVVRLDIDVRLSQQTNSEYANTHLYFKKPITVEVLSVGVVDTDGAALVAQINSLKDRFGFGYITATYTAGSDLITLTATDFNQRFYSIKISEEAASYNSIIQPEYTLLSSTFAITTKGNVGFGNDEYMAKAIRLQTLDSYRPFGISKDELPVLGGQYTQYTIRYAIDNDGVDGVFVMGAKSITTHVFYVLSTYQAAFEDELEKVFPAIVTIGGTGTITIIGDEVLDLSNAETTTLSATNYSGTITWTSGTAGTATINSSTGVVTAVAAGTTTITATDTAGSTGTFLLTVVA